MATNIWRRCPSGILRQHGLFKKSIAEAGIDIANEFWEVVSGGDVTGIATTAQKIQSLSASGFEIFIGQEAGAQKTQSLNASGIESFIGTVQLAQVIQSLSGNGIEAFIGNAALSQAIQQAIANGFLEYLGNANLAQAIQQVQGNGIEEFIGAIDVAQAIQSGFGQGIEEFIDDVSLLQAIQILSAEGKVYVTGMVEGTVATVQQPQTAMIKGMVKELKIHGRFIMSIIEEIEKEYDFVKEEEEVLIII